LVDAEAPTGWGGGCTRGGGRILSPGGWWHGWQTCTPPVTSSTGFADNLYSHYAFVNFYCHHNLLQGMPLFAFLTSYASKPSFVHISGLITNTKRVLSTGFPPFGCIAGHPGTLFAKNKDGIPAGIPTYDGQQVTLRSVSRQACFSRGARHVVLKLDALRWSARHSAFISCAQTHVRSAGVPGLRLPSSVRECNKLIQSFGRGMQWERATNVTSR